MIAATSPIRVDIAPRDDLGVFFQNALQVLRHGDLEVDCTQVGAGDSSLVATLVTLQKESAALAGSLHLVNVSEPLSIRLGAISILHKPAPELNPVGILETAGASGLGFFRTFIHLLSLFTESVYWSTWGRLERHALPIRGTMLQMVRLGSDAVPIVFVLSFLIGLTLAFQSAVQLEPFGGSLYMVRGIGISMFSEIGPLLTAIILAGRSGSAITAEMASMVVQEEVKALRTMGIHPVPFLVVPRFQAMTITVPLLTFISVFAGILAGFVIAILFAKLPTALFLSELRGGVPLKLIWQCAVKSMTFGWIIVLVASHKGFAVHGGADAVGRATTECVVFSISAIILTDAIFSFLFY